jgi:hypothetical protein
MRKVVPQPMDLSADDIRSRFFTAGPTDIYNLLGAIDSRIAGYNAPAQGMAPACLNQAPVSFSIQPWGESMPFYAQCYDQLMPSASGDPGLVLFGRSGGRVYYYMAVGAGWIAAVLTPVQSSPSDEDASAPDADTDAGEADAQAADADTDAGEVDGAAPAPIWQVHAWSGVGYLNANGCGSMNGFDDCSYGAIELTADASVGSFEMAVAGIGFGYCGAQLKSDGTLVYGIGSPDMGTTCGAPDSFCATASDLSVPSVCSGAVTMFGIKPLGRVATTGPNAGGPGAPAGSMWAASEYPGSADQIVLNGTATDSLHFGPTTPPAGVGSFH